MSPCKYCGKLTNSSAKVRKSNTGFPCCLKCIRLNDKHVFWILLPEEEREFRRRSKEIIRKTILKVKQKEWQAQSWAMRRQQGRPANPTSAL